MEQFQSSRPIAHLRHKHTIKEAWHCELAYYVTGHTFWKSAWVAMRTTLAPESLGKLLSWNCWEIFQGIRSPEGLFAREEADATDSALILPGASELLRTVDSKLVEPSRATWTTQKISGSELVFSSSLGSKTKRWCAGASLDQHERDRESGDRVQWYLINKRSFGEFL